MLATPLASIEREEQRRYRDDRTLDEHAQRPAGERRPGRARDRGDGDAGERGRGRGEQNQHQDVGEDEVAARDRPREQDVDLARLERPADVKAGDQNQGEHDDDPSGVGGQDRRELALLDQRGAAEKQRERGARAPWSTASPSTSLAPSAERRR